jgi:DNA polymerase III sliding clamp (beta) subunit (PCNA family)
MIRAELLNKLELVGRALADNNLIPVFQCFCFTGTHVYANNDSLAIKTPCLTDHPFAVNGKTLLGLLRASQSEEVTFKLGDEHEVLVKAGKSNFKLPYHTEDEFLFKEPEDQWDLIIKNPSLATGLAACLQTASRDAATQPAFVGVWLKFGSTLYSCDGDALSRFELSSPPPGGSFAANYMMPNAFCESLLRIEGSAELRLNPEWAKASLGEYEVFGRLIVNENPLDHEKLIEDTIKQTPVFAPVPEGLVHALDRARVVGDPESKPTQLTVEIGKLRLVTDTPLGVVKDVLPLEHPDVTALAAAHLLQRSIAQCKEMAIMANCCVFRDGEILFQLVSNYG